MTNARKAKHGWILTTIFSILSVIYVLPIFIVLINSFKRKAAVFSGRQHLRKGTHTMLISLLADSGRIKFRKKLITMVLASVR